LKYATKIWNENFLKICVFEIWNEKIETFIFEIWNEIFRLKFEKKIGHITRGKWKKNEMKKSYITPIIPLYHLCISRYIIGVSCGGIQLISVVRSFHTSVVWYGAWSASHGWV
jgi:hypothetical protein